MDATHDLDTWLARGRHQQLAVLVDLDGTLIPFAATAELAVLDREGAALLEALHATGVRVVVVSGRPQPLLERMRGDVPNAWLVAEHGAWRCGGDQWSGPPAIAADLDVLARTLAELASVPGVRFERKSLTVCMHWREVAAEHKERLIAAAELACDEWLETRPDYERIDGVEMLEVRMTSWHKGAAVTWVREAMPGASIIALGDDHTDEDMFAALREDELAIRVGPQRPTRGNAWLRGPTHVRELLAWIARARAGEVTAPPAIEVLAAPRAEAPRTQLLVVSNRTPPVSTSRQRNVGGLVSALEPALRASGGMWLGWSGHEREGDPALVIDEAAEPPRASFDLPHAWREAFYSGFCNRALWPLFHGFPGRVHFSDTDWHAYVVANEAYARFATRLVEPGGTVWAHDYHLLLLGRALRRHGFTGKAGLFLHIPFPSRDLLDTLPWSEALLAGMCAYDLVGFHTAQWADNFKAAVHAHGLRLPSVAVLPIGIDARSFAPTDAPLDPEIAGLRATIGERRLILGVDRLDYAKGIPERLAAFERLLELRPEWRSRVNLVQVSVPSRADVPEYGELRATVEKLVGRINGRFGEADWVPVRYLYRSYGHEVLAQLYRCADVALVTPLRDGLNLVAKEFVAAQDPANPGVLVLSRFAGAAAELKDAVLTNPFHIDGLTEDLDRALRMPGAERLDRHARLAAAIAGSTPQRWGRAFLRRLARAGAGSRRLQLLDAAAIRGDQVAAVEEA